MAERLSVGLVKMGHKVSVYNSHNHPYQEKSWKGVNIIHCYDPEYKVGTFGQFVYDLNCIINTRQHRFDVILNLGYTSSSVWMRFFPRRSLVITNMDGIEWKRSKYSRKVQAFLKYAEKLAVKHSDLLVADSTFIQSYIFEKYKTMPLYIAYGAELFNTPDESALAAMQLKPFGYNMIVARMEPENNIETILDGIQASASPLPFLVIGSATNAFGAYLQNKYRNDARILFKGPVYDLKLLNNLRYYSNMYFHGHSVGGTNPSLLEAMGCQCFIVAHDNGFNRAVLGNNSFYFNTSEDIKALSMSCDRTQQASRDMISSNYTKIKESYLWESIIGQYENMMTEKKVVVSSVR